MASEGEGLEGRGLARAGGEEGEEGRAGGGGEGRPDDGALSGREVGVVAEALEEGVGGDGRAEVAAFDLGDGAGGGVVGGVEPAGAPRLGGDGEAVGCGGGGAPVPVPVGGRRPALPRGEDEGRAALGDTLGLPAEDLACEDGAVGGGARADGVREPQEEGVGRGGGAVEDEAGGLEGPEGGGVRGRGSGGERHPWIIQKPAVSTQMSG